MKRRATDRKPYNAKRRRVGPIQYAIQPVPPVSYVSRRSSRRDELKYADLTVDGAELDATASNFPITSLLTNLLRGDGVLNNFDGGKIFPQYIRASFLLDQNPVSLLPSMNVRIVIFQWFDAAAVTAASILQYTGVNGASMTSPKLVDNMSNIRLLYDQVFDLNAYAANTGAGSTNDTKSFKVFIPAKYLSEVVYKAGSTVVQKGDLYLMALGDTSTIQHRPLMSCSIRTAFYD